MTLHSVIAADQVQDSRVSQSGRLATDRKAVQTRGPGRVVLGSKPQLATTEELVRWVELVNWAGSKPQLATTEKLVRWAALRFSRISSLRDLGGDGPRYGEAEGTFFWDESDQAGGGEDQELVRFVADDQL